MPKCDVGHRLYHHTHKWSPNAVMPDAEQDKLIAELIKLSSSAIPFILEHIEGDAFYEQALKNWETVTIPRAREILSQLFYHSIVGWYTIRGLNIRWQWADKCSQDNHRRTLERMKLQFEKYRPDMSYTIHTCALWSVIFSPDTVARNVGAEILEHVLDGYSVRMKIAAEPETIEMDAWTERLYKDGVNRLGQQAHYMHLKLNGAMFQFELVPPSKATRRASSQRGKRSERLANSPTGRTAIKWLNRSS